MVWRWYIMGILRICYTPHQKRRPKIKGLWKNHHCPGRVLASGGLGPLHSHEWRRVCVIAWFLFPTKNSLQSSGLMALVVVHNASNIYLNEPFDIGALPENHQVWGLPLNFKNSPQILFQKLGRFSFHFKNIFFHFTPKGRNNKTLVDGLTAHLKNIPEKWIISPKFRRDKSKNVIWKPPPRKALKTPHLFKKLWGTKKTNTHILLMEEIPSNHLGCVKPCK